MQIVRFNWVPSLVLIKSKQTKEAKIFASLKLNQKETFHCQHIFAMYRHSLCKNLTKGYTVYTKKCYMSSKLGGKVAVVTASTDG